MKKVEDHVEQACCRSLDRILHDLQNGLKFVRDKDLSADRLHNLRVSIRRTESAVFMCQPWLRKSDRRWFEEQCQRLRTTSNAVRDCDVALNWIEKHGQHRHYRKRLRSRRKRAGARLVPLVAGVLRAGQFKYHRKRIYRPENYDGASTLAARLLKLTGQFTELAADAFADAAELHRWRVAGKKLRYALDFLAVVGCEAETEDARTALEELQDRLGSTTDQVQRQRLMQKSKSKNPEQLVGTEDLCWFLNCIQTTVAGVISAASWCIAVQERPDIDDGSSQCENSRSGRADHAQTV